MSMFGGSPFDDFFGSSRSPFLPQRRQRQGRQRQPQYVPQPYMYHQPSAYTYPEASRRNQRPRYERDRYSGDEDEEVVRLVEMEDEFPSPRRRTSVPKTIPVRDASVKPSIPPTSASVPPTSASVPPASASVPPRNARVPSKKYTFATRDAAATKIQSVYRGHGIRQWKPLEGLRTIRKVQEELTEFQKQVEDPEHMKIVRQDFKQKVMLSEGVMKLVLRLDSVSGGVVLVRDRRKALVCECLRLQDRIEAILSAKEEQQEVEVMDVDESPEVSAADEDVKVEFCEVSDAHEDQTAKDEVFPAEDEVFPAPIEVSEAAEGHSAAAEVLEASPMEVSPMAGGVEVENSAAEVDVQPSADEVHCEEAKADEEEDIFEEAKEVNVMEAKQVPEVPEVNEDGDWQVVTNEDYDEDYQKCDDEEDSKDGTMVEGQVTTDTGMQGTVVDGNQQPSKEERDTTKSLNDNVVAMLAKLAEDNFQMKAMMEKCIKQNQIQAALIKHLSDRVSKLEKKSKKQQQLPK